MSENQDNVALFILKALKQEGIDHIFLVPGGMIDPFLPNYSKAGVQAVVAAHEGGAAYMADGYARARQSFGVCMGIGGPGVTNMVTAISAAYADRSPVLVVSGMVPPKWEGDGAFQDSSATSIDDHEIMRPITVWAECIPAVEKVGDFLKKAIRAMRGIENRPAFISVPLDLQSENYTAFYQPLRFEEPARIIDTSAVRKVPEILAGATRIGIYAGNGCVWSKAGTAIREFAEKFSIPVVTTLRAKGAISEEHPLSFGVFGLGGSLQANKIVMGSQKPQIAKTEVLLVLGATLNENNTHGWAPDFPPSESLVRVDINPNSVVGKSYQETFVVGDVREFLSWLRDNEDQFGAALSASQAERESWIEAIRKTPYYDTEANRKSDRVPMHPARVIAELRKATPNNTVIVADSGAHTFFTGHNWISYAPNECLILTNTGPMGYGVAVGIGAKMARPTQPCVSVVGDGSMLMHGMEIQTAVRYNVPLVIVVINNSALGNVYLRAVKEGPEAAKLAELPKHNWAKFARSLGADGVVVKHPDQLAEAFEQALASKVPFVIDACCSRDCPTPNTDEPGA
jgi:acetolactate synthase-1/2/3 large subunit